MKLEIGAKTPWGHVVRIEVLAEGITRISTPSHGGIHLDEERNAQIPMQAKERTWDHLGLEGWYEEDCDWVIVVEHFPALFEESERRYATKQRGSPPSTGCSTPHTADLRGQPMNDPRAHL